ncbi:unnamed protein product, partial [Cylicostephanus goldi]
MEIHSPQLFSTTVDCAVSGDRSEFLFHFDQPFEVHDDFEALKRLGYSYGLEHNTLNPDMLEHIDEFIPPALHIISECDLGEMSDWESRARSSNPQTVQYVIRDPNIGGRPHASVFEQNASDHSSDGSYVEMAQPVYAAPGYAYSLPAYETEVGEEMELVEQPEYVYAMPGTSTGYEVVDANTVDRSRSVVMVRPPSLARGASTSSVPTYALDQPSSSKV